MTNERRLELEEKLAIAEAHKDEAEIAAVKSTMEREYRECTSHTADRLKRVEATVIEIKRGLIPAEMFGNLQNGLKDVCEQVVTLKVEIESWKNKASGMKLLWQVLGYIVAAGGGGWLISLLKASTTVAQTPLAH